MKWNNANDHLTKIIFVSQTIVQTFFFMFFNAHKGTNIDFVYVSCYGDTALVH